MTLAAFLWSLGLLVAALVVPVYGAATLVDENGGGVLLVVAIPAAITAVVWMALWQRCSHGRKGSGYVAWAGVWALAAFCLVSGFSIGGVVVPVALLLAGAALVTPAATSRPHVG